MYIYYAYVNDWFVLVSGDPCDRYIFMHGKAQDFTHHPRCLSAQLSYYQYHRVRSSISVAEQDNSHVLFVCCIHGNLQRDKIHDIFCELILALQILKQWCYYIHVLLNVFHFV